LSPKADYFSELIIYLLIKALAINPGLWNQHSLKDADTLLFTQADFNDIEQSRGFLALKNLGNPEIDILLNLLVAYCQARDIEDLEPLDEVLLQLEKPPAIISFQADRTFIPNGANRQAVLSWEVNNAVQVKVSGVKGKFQAIDQCTVDIRRDTKFTLQASAQGGKVSTQELAITVSDAAPVIHSFKAKAPLTFELMDVTFDIQVDGAEKLIFIEGLNQTDISGQTSWDTKAMLPGVYTLKAISYFGVEISQKEAIVIKPLPRVTQLTLPKIPDALPLGLPLPEQVQNATHLLRPSQILKDSFAPPLLAQDTRHKSGLNITGLYEKLTTWMTGSNLMRRISKYTKRNLLGKTI
ncbi:MAG: hypothetical protein AAFV07_12650, partial [Bacteroidota bacterium]